MFINVIIFGTTGGIGKWAVKHTLQRGHHGWTPFSSSQKRDAGNCSNSSGIRFGLDIGAFYGAPKHMLHRKCKSRLRRYKNELFHFTGGHRRIYDKNAGFGCVYSLHAHYRELNVIFRFIAGEYGRSIRTILPAENGHAP